MHKVDATYFNLNNYHQIYEILATIITKFMKYLQLGHHYNFVSRNYALIILKLKEKQSIFVKNKAPSCCSYTKLTKQLSPIDRVFKT